MNKENPSIIVSFGEEDFEMNRQNGFLYTFLGQLAVYDHVFILTDPEESAGTFIFKVCHPISYNHLGAFMVENKFIGHMNAQEVSDSDRDCFERATLGDVRAADSFPEEWDSPPANG